MRAKVGILKTPMAMIEFTIPAPKTAVSMMADRIAGNAKVKSDSRMISSSIQPRRAAATRPSAVPATKPMPTAMIPTVIELRAPTSSSDTMSRPKGSVPSQWLDEGVCSLAAMSIS